MSKQVTLGTTARENLVKGIDTLADAVVSTLGPNGRNVVIANNGVPQSTKDGVTVAKSISLANPEQELGVQLVKQAAIQTAEKAGDGTTTSTLLAREMVKAGLHALNNNENAVQIKRDIDSTVKQVVNNLRNKISEEISGEEQLEQIASISANNDPETGKLIATAIDKVGMEGVVHIEESRTGETYLETVEGLQFDRGYKSPYFVTDNNSMTATLDNPLILIADQKLTQVKELLPVLEAVSAQAKSLLIIAEDIDNEALATLIVNKMRGILNICAVKAPDFGDRRTLLMNDMATLTGGVVVDKDKGMKLEKFDLKWLGECRTVNVTKEQTTIVDGAGDEIEIASLCTQLQSQIENSNSPFEMEKLQERLAKLTGGVAVVHVGGNTETEMKERKDRVDDALQATKAAIEEGIIPGGGVALLRSGHKVTCNTDNADQKIGCNIMYNALRKPFEQILVNAGVQDVHGIEYRVKGRSNHNTGYNIKNGKFEDFLESGIIDPTKVTRCALENAASIAGTVLLTECTVVNKSLEKEEAQLGGMPGMF